MIVLGAGRVDLAGFMAAVDAPALPAVAPALRARLIAARATVDAHAAGAAPVYGLNTGLGGNLAQRLGPGEIAAFQHQILAGRAVAMGAPLPEPVGRAVTLARLVSAAAGVSGVSLPLFDHLRAGFAAGLSPVIPEHGSIGAGDLVQNAVWARALLGQGEVWQGGAQVPAAAALARAGLAVPDLAPKDAMALINHGGLTVALSAMALSAAAAALSALRGAILLSYAGYGANPGVLDAEINALRPAPGQAAFAGWLRAALGPAAPSGRVQEALSFRTVAPVQGAAEAALAAAVAIWEEEANGASDSPAVLPDGAMPSTANFHAPALALALEQVALALAMAGNGAVQRMQRMMTPALSGLPRYLSPEGGVSAGMVPMQKTAAALLAEIRRHAMPVVFDPAPVSDAVEDMAPMTPQAARKLCDQARSLSLLAGLEALVAAQAIDLRGAALTGTAGGLHAALRARIAALGADRAQGADMAIAAQVLARAANFGPYVSNDTQAYEVKAKDHKSKYGGSHEKT